MEFNLKSEMYLNMLRVGSVSGSSGGSTSINKLTPSDICAAMGMISDKRYSLALHVGGRVDESEYLDSLFNKVVDNLADIEWYQRSDMQSSKYRVTLYRAIRLAINMLAGLDVKDGKQINQKVVMNKSDRADFIKVDRSNYYRVWESRVEDIYKMILNWCFLGDKLLFGRITGQAIAA